MTRWAMVADLERCVGCQTCTAACKHANATTPAVQWRRVIDVESGAFPQVSRTFVPVGCQHCADPPCMHVCPSTATRKRPDGIVTIDFDVCIGCAYCDVACPYQARFKIDEAVSAYGGSAMRNEVERDDPARVGVAQKCSFCVERIDAGLAQGLVPGRDPAATPACVNSCIADALKFGDLDDPQSVVSERLRDHRHFRMHAELGTAPGFYYLYDKASAGAAPPPEVIEDEKAGRSRNRGVEPAHQKHWDWKAAVNFLCAGIGSGLLVFGLLLGPIETRLLVTALALAIIGAGLATLLFKLGRPRRFLSVLRQPQRSWMSREAWCVGVLAPGALLAAWSSSFAAALVAALLALAFLLCQGKILEHARGIPAWRQPQVVSFIIVTGLAEGGGLYLMLPVRLSGAPLLTVSLLVVALAVVRAWTWRRYVKALQAAGAPTRTFAALRPLQAWLVGAGLLAPAGLVALGLALPDFRAGLVAVAGLCVLTTGCVVKFILITRAAYHQGFALLHTPVRGAGRPGPGVRPGWTLPARRAAAAPAQQHSKQN